MRAGFWPWNAGFRSGFERERFVGLWSEKLWDWSDEPSLGRREGPILMGRDTQERVKKSQAR